VYFRIAKVLLKDYKEEPIKKKLEFIELALIVEEEGIKVRPIPTEFKRQIKKNS
jgi:hypothetical protein